MNDIPFPDAPDAQNPPCSYHECLNGHRYAPQINATQCPDCRAAVLAIRMIQCPYCNEPTIRTNLRCDFLSTAMAVLPVCNPNAQSQAEVTIVTLEHTHYKQPTQ